TALSGHDGAPPVHAPARGPRGDRGPTAGRRRHERRANDRAKPPSGGVRRGAAWWNIEVSVIGDHVASG
ncbi:hypothetical protein, partial [Streptomyces bohaiensis]|uniref:hypothetical protein n=1 Tax=Streptomyces bohaiensis TaxID=1431344 RepID=UPI001ADDE0E1